MDAELLTAVSETEFKFNPYHDPRNGRFTFAPGGSVDRGGRNVRRNREGARPKRSQDAVSRYYRGVTASGVGTIKPVSGGHLDPAGRYVPELFPPDRYALSNPTFALAHYVAGSGDARNYYFNTLDTSKVKLTTFAEVRRILKEGKPGLYQIVDSLGSFDSGLPLLTRNLSPGATIGGAKLRANGVLAISREGRYSFDGKLAADVDSYDFEPRKGRSQIGDVFTMIGRQFPGKKFKIYIVGSKPFSETGTLSSKQR